MNGSRKIFAKQYVKSPQDIISELKTDVPGGPKIDYETHTTTQYKSFSTKNFFIRYWEEEVHLNFMANYRAEIELSSDYENQPLFLEANLLFGDTHGNFDIMPKDLELNLVNKVTYRINQPILGLNDYLPLCFGNAYSSLVNTMIHVSCVDYRISHSNNRTKEEIAAILAKKYFPSRNGGIRSEVTTAESDAFHEQHLDKLVASYEKLRDIFQQLTSRWLTPAKRDWLSSGHRSARLTLPGNPVQVPYSMPRKFGFSHKSSKSSSSTASELEDCLSSVIRDKIRLSKFSDRVSSHDPIRIITCFLVEMQMIAQQIFGLWMRLLEAIMTSPRQVFAYLNLTYIEAQRVIADDAFVTTVKHIDHFPHISEPETGINNKALVQDKRQEAVLKPRIEEVISTRQDQLCPIFIETRYTQAQQDQDIQYKYEFSACQDMLGSHLFILVHGFQGNSNDTRLVRNKLAELFPYALFLSAAANEQSTEGDIGEMGFRLAQEVTQYIQEWCPGDQLGRISFIGHSLGGIIIRAALPYLERYSNKMHMFMSLSTPHLGYTPNKSKLVNAGLWVVKKWLQSKGLSQLTLWDGHNVRKSELYQLSSSIGLEWFRYVLLASSSQDDYVPFDSARMEVDEYTLLSKNADYYAEMAQNMVSRISATQLIKLDANFVFSDKNLDYFIGRSAHI